jgi:phosphoribosyl-ATP pyrophosphohydrolase/phosphoribosyl-AMP cyclohydrolase
VQLRRGRELVLDGGDPFARLDEFGMAGDVAVVDLDAALGQGSNAAVIREMVRRAPCRVGGAFEPWMPRATGSMPEPLRS